MKEIQNNALFWQKLDTLLASSLYKKVRDIHESHPKYPLLVYPVEYGHLYDTDVDQLVVAKIFKGSLTSSQCDAVIVAIDILQKELDIKLLVGCDEREKEKCLEFSNQTHFQKTILVSRSNELPAWAVND